MTSCRRLPSLGVLERGHRGHGHPGHRHHLPGVPMHVVGFRTSRAHRPRIPVDAHMAVGCGCRLCAPASTGRSKARTRSSTMIPHGIRRMRSDLKTRSDLPSENWKDSHEVTGDITNVDAVDIPDVELILASFPGQPFSIAVPIIKVMGTAMKSCRRPQSLSVEGSGIYGIFSWEESRFCRNSRYADWAFFTNSE